VLLCLSGVFYVFGNLKSKLDTRADTMDSVLNEMYITTTGVVLVVAHSFLSGFVAVYNEKLLKSNLSTSIHLQNVFLYVYGTFFNFLTFYFNLENDGRSMKTASGGLLSVFDGFNVYTWLLILSQVFIGIATSLIMKHGSNIVRLFIVSTALVVNAFFCVVLFSLKLNFYFYISFSVISYAIYLYNQN
jgi:probable UDP-sugar transporter A4